MTRDEALLRQGELIEEHNRADQWWAIAETKTGSFLKGELDRLTDNTRLEYARIRADRGDAQINLVALQSREATLKELRDYITEAKNNRDVLDKQLSSVIEFLSVEKEPDSVRQSSITYGEQDE